MSKPDASISLADLAAAGIRLRPFEIVTIVRELVLQVARGDVAGVPSAHVIKLSPSGGILVEGPVAAGGRPVARAAQLLDTLLPGVDAPPEYRAPGALRLAIARALGNVDLPPFGTLEAFAAALDRFAGADPNLVVRQLVASWSESVAAEMPAEAPAPIVPVASSPGGRDDQSLTLRVVEPFAPVMSRPALTAGDLTVSDVRRARRATGLTLAQVGDRSRIPIKLLRELEWGYLRNWPGGHYGRIQLVRYAKAAGLDEEVVVTSVWPLIAEEEQRRAPAAAFSAADILISPSDSERELTLLPPARRAGSRGSRILAALAIPALLAIAIAPVVWYEPKRAGAARPTLPRASAPSPTVPTGTPGGSRTDPPRELPAVRQPDRLVPSDAAVNPARRTVAAEPAEGLTGGEPAYSPTFSAAGSAMFYHAQADGRSSLMRADTDAEGAVLRITRIVDDTSHNFHVRPSPDGSRIAFDSDRDGERAVYVADADGQHVRRVTGEGFAAVPSWSPDGRSLAFVRAEPGKPSVWNLWTTDLATGTMRRLTNHSVGQPWGGSWFPEGTRIAYSHENRLVILDLETGAERVYPSPKPGRLVRTPAVSPDGRRIVFQVYRDGVWLLELKDGSMRRVLADPSAEEFTWSPDGTRVAYHSRRAGTWGVWVMASR